MGKVAWGERRDDFLDHPIRKILLLRIAVRRRLQGPYRRLIACAATAPKLPLGRCNLSLEIVKRLVPPDRMSAWGQKQTSDRKWLMSAFVPTPDIRWGNN
jgi:hypothetical protein